MLECSLSPSSRPSSGDNKVAPLLLCLKDPGQEETVEYDEEEAGEQVDQEYSQPSLPNHCEGNIREDRRTDQKKRPR